MSQFGRLLSGFSRKLFGQLARSSVARAKSHSKAAEALPALATMVILGVELTMTEVFGSATAAATPLSMVRLVAFGGLVVYPGFALMGI